MLLFGFSIYLFLTKIILAPSIRQENVSHVFNQSDFFNFTEATLDENSFPIEVWDSVYSHSSKSHFITYKQFNLLENDFKRRFARLDFTKVKLVSPDKLKLFTDRKVYYRFQIIKVRIIPHGRLKDKRYYAVLYKDGRAVPNAIGNYSAPFLLRNGKLVAKLSFNFRPKLGLYTVRVFGLGIKKPYHFAKKIIIKKRPLKQTPNGLAVMTLETAIPLKRQRVRGPYGKGGSYLNFFRWASILSADAFCILGSQTVGNDKNLSPQNPHSAATLANVNLLGKEAIKRGLDFGAYIISYFTPLGGTLKAGYRPSMSWLVDSNSFKISRHCSLGSKKRLFDLIKFAEKMQANKYVKYIGFDFIRTGFGDGFELVNRAVDELNIPVPTDWKQKSKKARMQWFASQVITKRNSRLINGWRWWRAHWVASIINYVIKSAKVTKSVWVYTLGWKHGLQHGQDPYMMLDAGCSFVFAMLYEANELQYEAMSYQWQNYLNSKDSSVLMGNCVDRILNHSYSRNPLQEFYRRLIRANSKFTHNGLAKGIFWHDVARAIWGRTGANSGLEWAIVGGSAITDLRRRYGQFPFKVKLLTKDSFLPRDSLFLEVMIENIGNNNIKNISVELLPSKFFGYRVVGKNRFNLGLDEAKRVKFSLKLTTVGVSRGIHALGVRIKVKGCKAYIAHKFVNLKFNTAYKPLNEKSKNSEIDELKINNSPILTNKAVISKTNVQILTIKTNPLSKIKESKQNSPVVGIVSPIKNGKISTNINLQNKVKNGLDKIE